LLPQPALLVRTTPLIEPLAPRSDDRLEAALARLRARNGEHFPATQTPQLQAPQTPPQPQLQPQPKAQPQRSWSHDVEAGGGTFPFEEFLAEDRGLRVTAAEMASSSQRKWALLTIVKDEAIMLPIWYRHYARHFLDRDMFIIAASARFLRRVRR